MKKKMARARLIWEYTSDINKVHIKIEGRLSWEELIVCMYDIVRFGVVLLARGFKIPVEQAAVQLFSCFGEKLFNNPIKENIV